MSIQFSKVKGQQFEEVCSLYQAVIEDMQAHGLKQWEWEMYPTRDQLESDMNARRLYRVEEDGRLVGAFALSDDLEEEYGRMEWHYGVQPATLHRFAMLPDAFGTELAGRVLAFVKDEALKLGFDSLRVDISCEDEKMLRRFSSAMTHEVGRIYLENFDMDYICFETPLGDDCPILPLRMHPAYRHGEMTPWGGDQLQTVYGRQIPDERTGEALEISAIPKLESITTQGEKLTDLIRRDGSRLVGKCAEGEFPLLLKLLAAKQSLSVQVHPDDAYAREHENKLGKTEAWVILKAEEGASILYGIKEGVTLDELRAGLESGADIEPMIERVPVKPGDVYFMPAGMVHAIGAGILLYEIQQSSDVTYRLWDFNRTNAAGEKRPLHIKQSLDVIDPELKGQRAQMPESGDNEIVRLLDVPAFRLDCVCVNGECAVPVPADGFAMLTALASLLLCWEGDMMQLNAGDTVLLPAACPAVTLKGVGRALMSRP